MRGNPIVRVASTHPYHRSGPISDDPSRERTEADAEQTDQADAGAQERPPSPSLPAQTLDGVLADELADLLWRRPELGPDQSSSSSRQRYRAQDSGNWRDQLLAEIEALAGELKSKVALYAMARAGQSFDKTSGSANEDAVAWIHETLEDIAATALGVEVASREAFLRAGQPRCCT